MTTVRALTSDPIEELVQPLMRAAVDHLDGDLPLLAGMGRYHLGWVDRDFAPAANFDQGKRMWPEIALLCCQAAGGAQWLTNSRNLEHSIRQEEAQ